MMIHDNDHPSSFSLMKTGLFKDRAWQEGWRG